MKIREYPRDETNEPINAPIQPTLHPGSNSKQLVHTPGSHKPHRKQELITIMTNRTECEFRNQRHEFCWAFKEHFLGNALGLTCTLSLRCNEKEKLSFQSRRDRQLHGRVMELVAQRESWDIDTLYQREDELDMAVVGRALTNQGSQVVSL